MAWKWLSKSIVVACALHCAAAPGEDGPPRRVAPPTRIPDPIVVTQAPVGEAIPTANVPPAVRRAVVADAAKRFKVAESAVTLVRAEQVSWPDGSLGCPEPGRMYTQMLVAGYRVVAKTSAGEMLYHTDSRGDLRICGAPVFPAKNIHEQLDQDVEPGTHPPPRNTPDR